MRNHSTIALSLFLNFCTIFQQASVKGWIEKGADPAKLVLGIGEYGRSFTLSSTSNTGVGASSSGAGTSGPYTQEAGMLGYNEVGIFLRNLAYYSRR